jgi:hypothetical protein
MKGELSIRHFDDRSFSAAEQLLSEAIELAGEQAALFWQLRAAASPCSFEGASTSGD